jgi:RNA polymerase sigma factor (sigma-70 family)
MTNDHASEEDDDETLVLRIAADQDKDALDLLLHRYGPKTKGYLAKHFGDTLREPERDQAFNDAVFNVWRFADRFKREKCSFKGWFIRIVQNAALSIIRAEKKHLAKELEYDPAYDPADHCEDDSPPSGSQDAWLVQQMNDIIDNELTGLEQAVAKADRAIGGSADTARLAEIHGKTLNNIYATRSKVRVKLRKLIQERQSRPGRKS